MYYWDPAPVQKLVMWNTIWTYTISGFYFQSDKNTFSVSGHKVFSKILWSDIQCHGKPPRGLVQPDVLADVSVFCSWSWYSTMIGWFLCILISYQGNTIFQIDQLFCYYLQETILINYHYNELLSKAGIISSFFITITNSTPY